MESTLTKRGSAKEGDIPSRRNTTCKGPEAGKNCVEASGRRLVSRDPNDGAGTVRLQKKAGSRAWVFVRIVTFSCV